jgi:hypothetical protein
MTIALQGTVLICQTRTWGHTCLVEIPVELISIDTVKRLDGRRLIAAFFFLFVPIFTSVFIGFLLMIKSMSEHLLGFVFAIIWIPSLVLFLFLVGRFFFRKTVVNIHINDSGCFSFWMPKRNRKLIEDLLNGIQERKRYVDERIPYPLTETWAEMTTAPLVNLAGLALLVVYLAGVIRFPWLMLLLLVPAGFYFYGIVKTIREPKLLRKARKHLSKKNYNEAVEAIHMLNRQIPGYLPARLLLVVILVKKEDWNGARSVLEEIENELETANLQSLQDYIIFNERISARKQMKITLGKM